MSSPRESHFLIVAPDVPNSKRENPEYRQKHIEYNAPFIQSGYIVSGGAFLPDGVVAADADALEKLSGSFIIVKADSSEKVWEKLKGDPFYSSGEVWDHAKLQVTSIFLAIPPKA